jgi:hypothetical protein
MGLYKNKFNPISGSFNLVPTATIVTFKPGVANAAALPVSGNALNDGRITADTGHLYIWDGSTWLDQGDIVDLKWSAIEDKPTSSVANIDSAVSLKHTQGTDQGLDTGGTNAVTAAQAKTGYTHSQVAHAPSDAVSLATVKADTDIDNAIDNTHAPHSDDQVIPTALSALSDDSTHRLVTDTEKGTWNGKQDSLGFSAQDIIDISLNVMLNAFRIAQIGSLTIFNMIKGFMDEYEDESGVDLVNSENQLYDNVDDYYYPYLSIDFDEYTMLLLHFDNNLTDATGRHGMSDYGASYSASVKKFGSHSAHFNYGQWIQTANSSDFIWGTGNFTVDFWLNFDTVDGLNGCYLWGQYGQYGYMRSMTYTSAVGETPGYLHFTNYTQWFPYGCKIDVTLTAGQWYHIALIRKGTTDQDWLIAVNGVVTVVTKTYGNANANMVDIAGPFCVVATAGPTYAGYVDEFRVSKGIARWTENFTPPTSAYTPAPFVMSLISNAQVADSVPTSARIILFEEDVDSITINTDLKVFVSRNNGTTFSQVTLEDEGNYITGARILSGVVDISAQPSGSNIKYKIEGLNSKNLKIHGTAVSWK